MTILNWKLLTAFEAVARHRNFTRAARELNVQQPAVSRRVAELESDLGVRLLERTRPYAALTREGEVLYRAISGSVLQVNSAVEQVRCQPDRNTVTINTTIGFASCYLMKRLPAFRALHPDISIELISRDKNDSYASDTDVVIVFDHPDKLPGIHKTAIFGETMVAVAHPKIAAAIKNRLCAVMDHPLLCLTMGIHADDWRTYFTGTDLEPRTPGPEQKFTSFMVYLQAALNGEGVMLGWETLLQDSFDLGQLAPVTDRRVETQRGYFACLMPRVENKPSAKIFIDWISSLAQATCEHVEFG
ncbi:Glycine cleavage system transcriptional activator [Roseovarius albus]|uniref:Glycine cleavage system transcriptional activator n=1 Tax=Roseovarius albus TaxID=1247867 RepID=A0A1X6Y8D2_9RHOB|nr:LysR family transcriptional regulator [Roseovarius albus]SLN13347.1 Glycine cleavage system transcriptional activator [Roseovarius albus]